MGKTLTQVANTQISQKRIQGVFYFYINGIDYTSSLVSWTVSNSIQFGSASGVFTLHNPSGYFSSGAAHEIKVGDVVELIEQYGGDTMTFKRFYGKVDQRSVIKSATQQEITLNCLDYISVLKNWDIDLELEGTKVEVNNELLTPNYLSAPNDMFSQVFDFKNNSIAPDPRPIIMIRDKLHGTDDPQFDGFDILNDVGQIKFGSPLNARDNNDVVVRSYFFYTSGLFIEDIIETLLTTPDGYGGYLFEASSATSVINNHLKTTYQDEQGAGVRDTMTPNYQTATIEIRHTIATAITAGQTTLVVDSVDGLPASGTASVAGNTFTWAGITASTKTLTGIPASGTNSLTAHPANSILKYETTYAAGRVWYMTYSNLTSDLVSANFSLPAGVNIAYVDKRYGRVILDHAISIVSVVKCNYNYEFKTLQASGIELNKISFRSREVQNRFEALQKLQSYLAPNYVMRTQGDNKVWSSYLYQKTVADYNLQLIQNLNILEDTDLYTRVVFYGKNANPTNVMFDENIDFVTTGQTYKAFASQNELGYEKTDGNKQVYKSTITDAGYITTDFFTPKVYINGIPIDNQLHQMISLPVSVETTTRTETTTESSKFGGNKTTVNNFYYYKILFAHQNIQPDQSIFLYNATGQNTFTISPHDSNMNYSRGIYEVPGDQQNATVAVLSTASYWVRYATAALQIDFDTVRFLIDATIIPDPSRVTIRADYEYYTVFTPQRGVAAIIDGRWDTQVQTEFFAEPPTGYPYAIIDLGQVRQIQAIDIIGGFYKPDTIRKFDIDMRISLLYSNDNIDYREISDKTHNIALTSGQSVSIEEDDLGLGLEARYIQISLENVKKLDFGPSGVWVVAITEASAYEDIVLKTEATLIPACQLTSSINSATTTIPVDSTEGFEDPDSGSHETAYVGTSGASFTYTGLTTTSFLGCHLTSGANGVIGDQIFAALADDTSIYDYEYQRRHLGDRLYKQNKIDDNTLYTQAQLNSLAKAYLYEFVKNHSKQTTQVMYSPFLQVGQTVAVTDADNNLSSTRFFIEAIAESSGVYQITLGRYPSDYTPY